MEPGRPRKPTKLKVLHGDDKKNPKRLNEDEPVPAAQEVESPDWLKGDALAYWHKMAPDRIDKGVLTTWDVEAFALFCECLVEARDAALDGPVISEKGGPAPLSRLKDAVNLCATLGGRFGWTPADRAKLMTREEPRDSKERLLS